MPGQRCPNMLLDFTDQVTFKSGLMDLQSRKADKSSELSRHMDGIYNGTGVYLANYVYNFTTLHYQMYGPEQPLVIYVIACGSDQHLGAETRSLIIRTLHNNHTEFKSRLAEFHNIKVPPSYFKEKSEEAFMYGDIQDIIETIMDMEEEPYTQKLKIMYDVSVGAPYIIVFNNERQEIFRSYITIRHYHELRPYIKINLFPVIMPDEVLTNVVQYLYELFYNVVVGEFDFYFVFKDEVSGIGESIIIEHGKYIDSRKEPLDEQQMLRTRIDKPDSLTGGSNRIRLHHRRIFTTKRHH
jgi:hypothetical protein